MSDAAPSAAPLAPSAASPPAQPVTRRLGPTPAAQPATPRLGPTPPAQPATRRLGPTPPAQPATRRLGLTLPRLRFFNSSRDRFHAPPTAGSALSPVRANEPRVLDSLAFAMHKAHLPTISITELDALAFLREGAASRS